MSNTIAENASSRPDFQYVVNASGETTGIVVPPKVFEALEEYVIDEAMGQAARDSKNEVGRPLTDFVNELRAAGEIDV